MAEDSGVTITRTSNGNLTTTRGVSVFSVKPEQVFEVAKQTAIYQDWNGKIVAAKRIHDTNESISVNYIEFSAIFPFAGRDVCFVQYATPLKKKGNYIILWHSTKHIECPKKKGIVRARFNTSGFVISPLPSNQSLVTFVLQFDLRGWVPQLVMDQITSMQVCPNISFGNIQ